MVNAYEILILLVSTGVMVLTITQLEKLVMVPFWKILMAAFIFYYVSTVLTVLEGFFMPDIMNFLEHLSRALFPGAVLLWIMALARSRLPGRGRS